MKGLLKNFFLGVLFVLACGCLNPEIDPADQCFEGRIPGGYYRLRFTDCYKKSIWIEVSESIKIGKNVSIPMAAPVLHPRPPIEYKNVVEAIIPDYPIDENILEGLEASSIFFNYRIASDAEIVAIRNNDPNCIEVYENLGIPVIVITKFSFETCPNKSESF